MSSESDDDEGVAPEGGGRPSKQMKTAEDESNDGMSVESPPSVDPGKWEPFELIGDIFRKDWFVSDEGYNEARNLSWLSIQRNVKNNVSNFDQKNLTIDVIELVNNRKVVKMSQKVTAQSAAPQDYGHEIPMAHDKDLAELSGNIKNVKDWHNERQLQQKYIAPLLPVIQSSGTGKSRLLKTYRNACRIATSSRPQLCALVLCGSGSRNTEAIAQENKLGDEKEYDDYYDTRNASGILGSADTSRLYEFVEKLCSVLIASANQTNSDQDTGTEPTDIVLMFDEAQHLTKQNPPGFLLRALRWITRENPSKRTGVLNNVNLTVVCSGTNSRLANFFPETEEASSSTRMTEQDVDSYYINHHVKDAKPYEPFFRFRTMGCLSNDPPMSDDSSTSEFECCVPFGRPLFEMYRRQKELEKQMAIIVGKVVLGKKIEDITTAINVLGTRVQMGSSSFAVVSDLVGVGYAHLTSFRRPDEEARPSNVIADFAYMPDPVCARIAMMLMDGTKILDRVTMVANDTRHSDSTVQGKNPSWWSSRATDIFSKSICVMNKGDIGEVAVALYLLFCGDVLRRDISEDYTTFSVDLISWLNKLLEYRGCEGKVVRLTVNCNGASASKYTINAIQFYREELRLQLDEYSSEEYLEYLYSCACGVYGHPNVQAFDLLKPIRFMRGNGYGYLPCFISVKNYEYLRPGLAKSFLKESVRALLKNGVKAGLLLLVIVGQTEVKSKYSNLLGASSTTDVDVAYMNEESNTDKDEKTIDELIEECVSTDIAKLDTKIVPKVLAIEPNDPFQINETAINGKPKLADISTVYTDHPMLLCMKKEIKMGERISKTLKDKDDRTFFDETLRAIYKET